MNFIESFCSYIFRKKKGLRIFGQNLAFGILILIIKMVIVSRRDLLSFVGQSQLVLIEGRLHEGQLIPIICSCLQILQKTTILNRFLQQPQKSGRNNETNYSWGSFNNYVNRILPFFDMEKLIFCRKCSFPVFVLEQIK